MPEDAVAEQVKRRLKEGWIQTAMLIEVLAVSEEAARSALEKHVQSMEKEKKTMVSRKDFKEIRRVENPLPRIQEGYSAIVELEVLAENFETLVYLAMNYAPSSIEILHPEKITIDIGEAQSILVSVAEMLHNFARSGLGGVVIKS